MSAPPLVSIIIPTFNRCAFLKETLQSICLQTHQDFEVIIVSDNSSDETAQMVTDLADTRCKLYVLPTKSTGPGFVRNYAIEKSRGEFIAFCDDDDLWLPQKLEKQIQAFQKNPKLAIIATNVKYFGNTQDRFLMSSIKALLNLINIFPIKYLLSFYNCLVISSVVVKKSVLDGKKFSEADEYQGHEDLDLWLRICSTNKATILTQKLVLYRVHQNQLSTHANVAYKKHSLLILKKRFDHFNFVQKAIYYFRLIIYQIISY